MKEARAILNDANTEWVSWELELAREALRFLERLRDDALKERLQSALEALRENPFHPGAFKLAGGW